MAGNLGRAVCLYRSEALPGRGPTQTNQIVETTALIVLTIYGAPRSRSTATTCPLSWTYTWNPKRARNFFRDQSRGVAVKEGKKKKTIPRFPSPTAYLIGRSDHGDADDLIWRPADRQCLQEGTAKISEHAADDFWGRFMIFFFRTAGAGQRELSARRIGRRFSSSLTESTSGASIRSRSRRGRETEARDLEQAQGALIAVAA